MCDILRIFNVKILLAILFVSSPALYGDENLDYVLAPLVSEFHRMEISPTASAILIWNGNSAETNRGVELLENSSEQLEADLRQISSQSGALLLIQIQYSENVRLDKNVADRLKDQLRQLASKCGFLKSTVSEMWTSSDWMTSAGALGTGLMNDTYEENLFRTQELIAAPIRTRISKLKTSLADVMIRIRRPFDAYNLSLSSETRNSIRNAVGSMELTSKNRIFFQVKSTIAGQEVIEALFSDRQPKPIPEGAPQAIKDLLLQERKQFEISPALELAQEMGFHAIACSHSAIAGSPELLLNKKAPEFELKSLGGESIRLESWRKGRPALITFWGIACGPCRLEAPHLSRLHEKYGERFAILGINAYPESEQEVAAFVAKEELKHPIVVGGESTAESSYNVASYPTSFWLNRRGEVVRYVVGFDDEDQLEEEIINFLAAEGI